jgi:hypothetical protein
VRVVRRREALNVLGRHGEAAGVLLVLDAV